MNEQKVFVCECGSYCHQAIFWYDKEDKQLHFTTHLITHRNFLRRVWVAIRYVFGYKSNSGDWDSFIFKSIDEERLRAYLNGTELTSEQETIYDFKQKIEEMIDKEKKIFSLLKSPV